MGSVLLQTAFNSIGSFDPAPSRTHQSDGKLAFVELSLKDLLIDAVKSCDPPETTGKLQEQIDHVFSNDHLESILNRIALSQESPGAERLFFGEGRNADGRSSVASAVFREFIFH